jgi:hypothetical protein
MNKELLAQKEYANWLLEQMKLECQTYLERLETLQKYPSNEAEGDVYAWLTQLEGTAIAAREAIDRADDLAAALEGMELTEALEA